MGLVIVQTMGGGRGLAACGGALGRQAWWVGRGPREEEGPGDAPSAVWRAAWSRSPQAVLGCQPLHHSQGGEEGDRSTARWETGHPEVGGRGQDARVI